MLIFKERSGGFASAGAVKIIHIHLRKTGVGVRMIKQMCKTGVTGAE